MKWYAAGFLVVLGCVSWGCAENRSMSQGAQETVSKTSMGTKPKDGELTFPAGYRLWAKFLSDVPRPDAKQVREIYINATGAAVKEGQPFANGSIMVMELYNAKTNGETLVTGPDGGLVKGDLAKVFVMEKGDGWGQDVPDPLKNGNWVFSAFGPDGRRLAADFSKCRACHAPLASKDFTHRLDQYLEQRAKTAG